MTFARQQDIQFLIDRFGYIRNVIELSNAENLTSINIIAENFFRDLLNLAFGYNLKNMNIDESNTAAIDLGDGRSKIAIQVTATGGKAKITKTLRKFCEKDLHEKFDKLIILIATKKLKYQTDFETDTNGKFTISLKNDVWDWSDLVKKIGDLSLGDIKKVRDFVEAEISIEPSKAPLKEVATFIDLMEVLSDETHAEAGKGVLREPDPSGKIEDRFSDHADFLLQEYGTYYSEYGSVLTETEKVGDLGAPRLRRLGLHLGTKSNQMLTSSGGDPGKALDKLVEFYAQTLQAHGKNSDEGAIRFFMLDQMIKCHVFPNPVQKSA